MQVDKRYAEVYEYSVTARSKTTQDARDKRYAEVYEYSVTARSKTTQDASRQTIR